MNSNAGKDLNKEIKLKDEKLNLEINEFKKIEDEKNKLLLKKMLYLLRNIISKI